jgi:hypothetical protein
MEIALAIIAVLFAAPVSVSAAVRASARSAGARVPWPVVTVLITIVLVALATDVVVLGPRWVPYALAGLVGLVVISAPRSGRPVVGDTAMALLLVWGLVGSLYGRLVLGHADNPLAFFFPMFVALLHLWRPVPVRAPDQARQLTHVLMYASFGYVILSYLVLVRGWSGLPVEDFKHETLYFVAMALVSAFLLRKWLILLVIVVLSAAAFLAYPALTWLVVLGATALLGVGVTGRRIGPVMIAIGAVTAALATVWASTSLDQLRIDYFSSVGKTDNTSTREFLLRRGVDRFLDSPVVGDSFTGDISVPSTVTGSFRLVPVHNDYLQAAMSGGALGAGLLIVWCAASIWLGVWLTRNLRGRGLHEHAALALVTTIGIAGMLVTAIFNPVLFDARNSLLLGLLHFVLASIRIALAPNPEEAGAR